MVVYFIERLLGLIYPKTLLMRYLNVFLSYGCLQVSEAGDAAVEIGGINVVDQLREELKAKSFRVIPAATNSAGLMQRQRDMAIPPGPCDDATIWERLSRSNGEVYSTPLPG